MSGGSKSIVLDPSRVAAQIVSGIGFLGAGAIIRRGVSIRGLTTAATLWVSAAIGMACGAGLYVIAIVATAIALIALWPLRFIAFRAIERVRPETDRLTVELHAGASVAPLLAEIPHVHRFEVSDTSERRIVQLESPDVGDDLVAKLSDLEGVTGVRWRH